MTDDHETLVEDTGEHPIGPPPQVILVAIDFSLASRHALRWALDHALHRPCHLHTIHVIDRRWKPSDLRTDLDALRAELVDVHDAAVAELAPLVGEEDRGRVGSLHEHVSLGEPAAEVCALAAELAADLIVVGSHGGDSLRRMFTGSTAQKVVRDATCPVVVVKETRP